MKVYVYFRSRTAAMAVRVSLGALYVCSQPMTALPREGRSVRLEVTLPSTLMQSRTGLSRALMRLITIVRQYDGVVVDSQDNRVIGEAS